MEKNDFQVRFKLYFLLIKRITQTNATLILWWLCTINSNSKKVVSEFRCSCISRRDDESSRRSVEVAILKTVEIVHGMGLVVQILEVWEIVESTGISHDSVVSNFNSHLSMKNLSERWLPRLLTNDHKRNCEYFEGVLGVVYWQ